MKKEEDNKIYCKSIKRPSSLTDIKAWYIGESCELKKYIGQGFFNHIFVSEKDIVRLYYNYNEEERVWNALQQKITEDFFNELCNNFFQLIEQSEKTNSHDELFNITVKCWPTWTIFDYISKYPELVTNTTIRRLIRIRKTTEAFSFELSDRMNHENSPSHYIFFKGNIIEKPFEHFLNENNMVIKENE